VEKHPSLLSRSYRIFHLVRRHRWSVHQIASADSSIVEIFHAARATGADLGEDFAGRSSVPTNSGM
jgi:hypothetical protein